MAIHMFKSLEADNKTVKEWNVTYEGRVLFDGERNGYDDSDFYAIVWDEEAGEMRNITYASTRGWSYPNNAVVDFTEEKEPEAWAAMIAVLKPKFEAEARADLLEANKVPKVGDEVRVVHGPGIDTVGTVFWVGTNRAGRGETRCGVSASGKKVNGKFPDAVWTLLTNTEKTINVLSDEDEERLANIDGNKCVNAAVYGTRSGYGMCVI